MKLSSKLDALQKLAREHENHPHKLYLMELLAEHAEEDEMSAGFIAWIEMLLSQTDGDK